MKARLVASGELPDSYAAFFCHTKGVDGQFMSFFSLDREQIVGVAELNDQEVKEWFLSLPQVNLKRIEEWNNMAENFGRDGFPMQEQLKKGLMSSYSHLAHLNLDTVFDVLEADDEIINSDRDRTAHH